MKLAIGIVGLPNVGKSTLFNALTKKSVSAENYPFCTIDPSVGIVPVPDERLEKLAELSGSEKVIPAVVEFVDIAGLVAGAHQGEGLGNKFLANIREVDAIAHVVRIFEDPDITHVHGSVDPRRDIEVINTELILADLETVRKRKDSIERDVKRGDKEARVFSDLLERLEEILDSGTPVSAHTWNKDEEELLATLHLLSAKKVLFILNVKAGAERVGEEVFKETISYIESQGAKWVVVDAGIEHELKESSFEERKIFKRELGIDDDGMDALIRAGYELLDLITFFTTGEKETRAWTISRGSTAPEAGTAIHTDFKDKFIRAEVIFWEDLISSGSRAKAREKGLLRTEGKEYIVKDGDVLEFKI